MFEFSRQNYFGGFQHPVTYIFIIYKLTLKIIGIKIRVGVAASAICCPYLSRLGEKTQKYGNYARTLKASHGSLGRAMDLIPKPRTLKKVQLRDISWNLTPPTPAHGPRGHFIKAFFTPQYSRENVGISRIDLHCQKPLNSLNLMVFLKFSISHYKWSKSAVKSGRFWDRGRLAGVWRSAVWPGFPPIV